MRRFAGFLMIGSLLGSASCASIVASGPDLVPINSEPDGAKVLLDGIPIGKTPMTAAIPRKSDGVLTFQLDGYSQGLYDSDKVLNGWFIGNLLFGGLIGITIDLVTSNQGKYSTDPIFVQLIEESGRGSDDGWKDN